MKKRYTAGILILLALLSLCACTQTEKEEPPITDPEVLQILKERPPEPLSPQQSEEMARFMYANRALVTEDALYCFNFDESYSPVLARYSLNGNRLSGFKILADNCVPEYLTMLDGRLFYINRLNEPCMESILPDGSDRKTVAEYADYLQTAAGRLWFCNEKGYFCSIDADGGELVVHVAESCSYPYVMGGTILYQSGRDGERLHLLYREDGTDVLLSSDTAYAPVIIGDTLYYTRRSYSGQDIFSMSLDGRIGHRYLTGDIVGAAEVYCDGNNWQARYLTDTDKIRQWTVSLDDPESAEETVYRGWRRCDYSGGGWQVETGYNPDGRVNGFYLTAPDGKEIRYMAGIIEIR